MWTSSNAADLLSVTVAHHYTWSPTWLEELEGLVQAELVALQAREDQIARCRRRR